MTITIFFRMWFLFEFLCDTCGISFVCMGSLIRHMGVDRKAGLDLFRPLTNGERACLRASLERKTLVPKLENSLRDLSTGNKIDFSSNRISTTVFIHPFMSNQALQIAMYHSITATKSNSQNWTQVNQLKTTHKTQHNITQINFLERTHVPRRSCFTTAKTWSQTSQTMWASRAPTASAGINLFWEGKYRVAEVPAKLKVHFWRIHKCKVWSPCEAEPPSPLCGGCPGPPTLPAWAAWWVLALFTIHPPHCVHWSAFVFGEGPRCRTNQMISAKGEHLLAPNVRTKIAICKSAKLPWHHNLELSLVFLSFCQQSLHLIQHHSPSLQKCIKSFPVAHLRLDF